MLAVALYQPSLAFIEYQPHWKYPATGLDMSVQSSVIGPTEENLTFTPLLASSMGAPQSSSTTTA